MQPNISMRNKWMKLAIITVMAVSATTLVGCGKKSGSWFRDRSHDYETAESIPNMGLPQGVHAEGVSHEYSIPGEC